MATCAKMQQPAAAQNAPSTGRVQARVAVVGVALQACTVRGERKHTATGNYRRNKQMRRGVGKSKSSQHTTVSTRRPWLGKECG